MAQVKYKSETFDETNADIINNRTIAKSKISPELSYALTDAIKDINSNMLDVVFNWFNEIAVNAGFEFTNNIDYDYNIALKILPTISFSNSANFIYQSLSSSIRVEPNYYGCFPRLSSPDTSMTTSINDTEYPVYYFMSTSSTANQVKNMTNIPYNKSVDNNLYGLGMMELKNEFTGNIGYNEAGEWEGPYSYALYDGDSIESIYTWEQFNTRLNGLIMPQLYQLTSPSYMAGTPLDENFVPNDVDESYVYSQIGREKLSEFYTPGLGFDVILGADEYLNERRIPFLTDIFSLFSGSIELTLSNNVDDVRQMHFTTSAFNTTITEGGGFNSYRYGWQTVNRKGQNSGIGIPFPLLLYKAGIFSNPPILILFSSAKPVGGVNRFRQAQMFNIGTPDEWRNLFKLMNIYCTWDFTELTVTPLNEWTVGNNQVSADISFAPGSGGFPGGIVNGGTQISVPGIPDPALPGGGGLGPLGFESDDYIDGTSYTGGASTLCNTYALNYNEISQLQKCFLDGGLWAQISAWFKDPQEGVINVLSFPFDVAQFAGEAATLVDKISILGVDMETDGDPVSGYFLSRGVKTRIPMGYIDVQELYESFMDWSPYTKLTVFLPYVGFKTIDVDKFMRRRISCYYDVDFMDGSCIAVLASQIGDTFVPQYIYDCNIAKQISISKSDAAEVNQKKLKTALTGLIGVITTIAGAAIGTAAAPGAGTAAGAGAGAAISGAISTAGIVTTSASAISNTVDAVLSKSHIQSQGIGDGNQGRSLTSIPFLLYEKPYINMPDDYAEIAGYQTNIIGTLKDYTGFTVCDNVKISSSIATETEKGYIKDMLMGGVIL